MTKKKSTAKKELEELEHRVLTFEDLLKVEPFNLTLRDRFAIAALQGMCVQEAGSGEFFLAQHCYKIADAMMETRKQVSSVMPLMNATH